MTDKVQKSTPVCQRSPVISDKVNIFYDYCLVFLLLGKGRTVLRNLFSQWMSINVPICVGVSFKGVIYDVIAITHYVLGVRTGEFPIMGAVVIEGII